MVCEPVSENAKRAKRRYSREMALSAGLYVAAVFAAAFAIRNFELPQWLVVALALLPLPPVLLGLRAYLTYAGSLDEFQRRIQNEAITIAAAVVTFSSFTYGFLEEWASFPHIPLIWVLPVFCGVFGIAQIFVRRRYK